MKYKTYNNTLVIDNENTLKVNYKECYKSYTLKEKLTFIVINNNLKFKSLKEMQIIIKDFLTKYNIINNNEFTNKYINHLISELIFNYKYLLN